MSIKKPYHRCVREHKKTNYSNSSSWVYIIDHDYADNPVHYLRAYRIIQRDVISLFEFIEPADINSSSYSFKIYELFLRICTEIEANFKAILKDNTFNPTNNKGKPIAEKNWNINHYKKINLSHHLSGYEVTLPVWSGIKDKRKPYQEWDNKPTLSWYSAYNSVKHSRVDNFSKANFNNLIDAFCALNILIYSQFRTEDFDTGSILMAFGGGSYYKGNFSNGDYLMIEEPSDWAEEEQYDFNWSDLEGKDDRFIKFDYDSV